MQKDPTKYRPITCLQTLYKPLAGIIARKMYRDMAINNVLTKEQKGYQKNSQGCKQYLVIDAIIMEEEKE